MTGQLDQRPQTDPRHAAVDRGPALAISVRGACGTGSTTLSAFDDALNLVGVANRNLIYLSSVIPPGSTVRQSTDSQPVAGGWGDRLYVVRAEARVEVHNEEAWAGIGWVLDHNTGRGLMVEHEGRSRAHVEADIDASLNGLVGRRPEFVEAERDHLVAGGTCIQDPVCALVVAVFQSEPWNTEEIDLRDGHTPFG